MLIERGRKIPSWENAVVKWKFDKKFINDYQQENVPQIVYEKIVLKYKKYIIIFMLNILLLFQIMENYFFV